MGRTTQRLMALLATITLLGGCAIEADAKGDDIGGEGKEDRWNWRNAPDRFDGQFNFHQADLPESGTAEREAWPSTYWPTYENAIVHRWQQTGSDIDDLSPAEKYDLAFNGWTPDAAFYALRPFGRSAPVPGEGWDTAYYEQLGPLATHVSRNMGNRADRELAVELNGAPEDTDDYPVETWFGLCHAWVPAALLEDRPLRPVTHNGVTFEVGDMEALLIAAYNRAPADMIGGRCNTGAGDEEVERDDTGRAVDIDCRDTNPGSMHVIITNYLGMLNRGFAMDRTFDYEVWNQPISGYEITRQEEITVEDANELLGLTGDTYTYNEDAAQLFRVHMSLDWVTESHASTVPSETSRFTRTDRYTYIIEVDAEGKIIGGEWFGNSRDLHPDFLWNPRRLTRSSTPNLSLTDVRMLIEMSRATEMPTTGDELVAMGQGDVAIPDNDADGVRSNADVMGGGVVATVSVAVDLTHTYVGDLIVNLEHGGVTRTLHNREGGSSDDINRTFTVVGFEGAEAAGAWTLHVSDRAGRDVGTLNGWTLTVGATGGTPMPPPTTNEMRFAGQGGVAIPDNNSTGVTSLATAAGVTDGDVSIEVNLTHTYIGDLLITVEHGGRTWKLHDREGGSDEDIHETYALDATGDAFTGDPSGPWTLSISDNANIDIGTLDSWAVIVN